MPRDKSGPSSRPTARLAAASIVLLTPNIALCLMSLENSVMIFEHFCATTVSNDELYAFRLGLGPTTDREMMMSLDPVTAAGGGAT